MTSPFVLKAYASGSSAITGWAVYANNVGIWSTPGPTSSISPQLSLGSGSYTIHIRAWQSSGAYGDYYFTVKVSGTSTPVSGGGGMPTPPSTAKVWTNLEDTTDNWKGCSSCGGGANSTNTFWSAPYQGSPSLDGSSREFFNGGGAWANVLWSKHLGAQSWASHFLWDFWVNFDSTTASHIWTAEFDLFQSVSGEEFMVGSQCNFGSGRWDIWSQSSIRWVSTSVPCRRFAGGSWHHIQWYVQRVSSNQYRYNTLAVDGVAYPINQTFYASRSGWADVVGIQWQLDQSSSPVGAHEWIDKVKLSIW